MNDNSKNNGSPLVKLLDFDKEARLQEIVDQYYTQAQNLAETINKISEIDNIIPGGDEKSDLFKSFLKAVEKPHAFDPRGHSGADPVKTFSSDT